MSITREQDISFKVKRKIDKRLETLSELISDEINKGLERVTINFYDYKDSRCVSYLVKMLNDYCDGWVIIFDGIPIDKFVKVRDSHGYCVGVRTSTGNIIVFTSRSFREFSLVRTVTNALTTVHIKGIRYFYVKGYYEQRLKSLAKSFSVCNDNELCELMLRETLNMSSRYMCKLTSYIGIDNNRKELIWKMFFDLKHMKPSKYLEKYSQK